MVNKNSSDLFRNPQPRDRLTSLVSWKRQCHGRHWPCYSGWHPSGSFPVFAFSNSVTQHLSCRQREPTATAQCLLYSYLLFLTFQNQNKFSSRSWDKYSFIFTYRHRGEKVGILVKVNWLPVLKSIALTVWTPAHLGYSTPSAISTWHEQAEYLVGK